MLTGINGFEQRARVLKAMAHPSRLLMIDELSRGERCVCDLTRLVGADISTVSKHLAVLKRVGIVADERRGQQVFYRLKVPCVLGFFHCIESVIRAGAQLDQCEHCAVTKTEEQEELR
jgi:DNA-binding transcriptional ArsR family regulator